MARNRRARAEFFTNYVNILFMVLSLIQGLAFQDLAMHARNILPPIWGDSLFGTKQAWIMILYIVVCLAVLIRVLQTYITVALDYGPKYVTLHDVVTVFVVGLLEAFLFNELGAYEAGELTFSPSPFWRALAYTSFVAAIIYGTNVYKVPRTEPKFLSKREEREELFLQGANCAFMMLLWAISWATSWWSSEHELGANWSIALTLTAIAILGTTTAVSLSSTFGIRAYFSNDSEDPVPFPKPRVGTARKNMTCRLAEDTDLDLIVSEAVRKYSPLLSAIFGTSTERISDILRESISAPSNSSPFSFENWLVVSMPLENGSTMKNDGQIGVGAMLIHSGPEQRQGLAQRLAHSISKISRVDKFLSLLSANRGKPIGGFSRKWAINMLGKRGADYLKEKLGAFLGPEIARNEIRVRLCLEREGVPPDDVVDCVLDALTGGGDLSGLLLESDKALRAALAARGLHRHETQLTNIVLDDSKVVFENWV